MASNISSEEYGWVSRAAVFHPIRHCATHFTYVMGRPAASTQSNRFENLFMKYEMSMSIDHSKILATAQRPNCVFSKLGSFGYRMSAWAKCVAFMNNFALFMRKKPYMYRVYRDIILFILIDLASHVRRREFAWNMKMVAKKYCVIWLPPLAVGQMKKETESTSGAMGAMCVEETILILGRNRSYFLLNGKR